ncbi:hypothetical protein DXG01_015758 [Tephrocybe rancida]|nr:hypothetical protein DXG01_015758 [Tephrocybe rancida]
MSHLSAPSTTHEWPADVLDAETDSNQGGQIWVSRFFALFASKKSANRTSVSKTNIEPDILLSLIAPLQTVFEDKEAYKRLVRCQAPEAQRLLDTFQQRIFRQSRYQLLDKPELDLRFRRWLIVATQNLSSRLELFPMCYKLDDVVQIGEYPEFSGGFADVYKGDYRKQDVAIKAIRLFQKDQTKHALRKFWKEAMLWGQLSHPNVLTIYGLFLFRNRVSIVSPWMKNGYITKYLEQNPDAPRALLAADVGSGLSYLHDAGIIHGDLKGVNILVDDAGRALLADFGLSSVSDADIVKWTSLSSSSSKGGTVRWQAPELFSATEDVESKNSKESDVYALGCVCYEIFTGQIPFARLPNDAAVILQLQLGATPKRPEATSPAWREWGLTEGIWLFMVGCWKRDTSKRPSAAAILGCLTSNLAEDTRQSPDTITIAPQEFRRRMRKSLEMMTVEELNKILNNRAGTPVLGMDATDSARSNPSNVDQREGETPYLGPAAAHNELFRGMGGDIRNTKHSRSPSSSLNSSSSKTSYSPKKPNVLGGRAKTGFTPPSVFGDTQDLEKRVVIAYITPETKSRRPSEEVVIKSHGTGYTQSQSRRPAGSGEESPYTYQQPSQSGDYYRDTNLTYNDNSNPNLRLGGSQQSHSNVSYHQPSWHGISRMPFTFSVEGPGSVAGRSNYGGMPMGIPQMPDQIIGNIYGMMDPRMTMNPMMSNMFGGSMSGSQSGFASPSASALGGRQQPKSDFSLATAVNPFGGPSTSTNPTDDELFNALRNYLSTQDLMTVTKKTAREAIMARFPQAALSSRKEFLNHSIDIILSES